VREKSCGVRKTEEQAKRKQKKRKLGRDAALSDTHAHTVLPSFKLPYNDEQADPFSVNCRGAFKRKRRSPLKIRSASPIGTRKPRGSHRFTAGSADNNNNSTSSSTNSSVSGV
jgi:hypothetical protein